MPNLNQLFSVKLDHLKANRPTEYDFVGSIYHSTCMSQNQAVMLLTS